MKGAKKAAPNRQEFAQWVRPSVSEPKPSPPLALPQALSTRHNTFCGTGCLILASFQLGDWIFAVTCVGDHMGISNILCPQTNKYK